MQQLSPIGWARRPLLNYAKFSGRASRAEFWWFCLFMLLFFTAAWIVLFAIAATVEGPGSQPSVTVMGSIGVGGAALILLYLAVLVPSIAVQVRRLHDINRSGWWLGIFWLLYPLYVVLIFGSSFSSDQDGPSHGVALAIASAIFALGFFCYSIVLFVFWCIPGTKGANRFGDDPYGVDVQEVFA
jgi:uncharacterized membrane protein YhaH (DUF805 family)